MKPKKENQSAPGSPLTPTPLPEAGRGNRTRVFLPSLLSAPLLWASFFPLDLGPLAFIALVPWLMLVKTQGVSNRRLYFAAFVGAFAFWLPALQWIRVASPPMYASWIVITLYCSLLSTLAMLILRRLDAFLHWPLAFTVPIVFVALDYFRAHFPTGFPFLKSIGAHQHFGFGWYTLGYTQHATAPLLQLADLGGVYLVTFLVCAFNGATAEWIQRMPWVRKKLRWPSDTRIGFFREMWTSAAATVSVMIGVAYGTQKLQHPDFEKGPRVTAIQGNFPQDLKMNNEDLLFKTYLDLCASAAKRADLVLWPETCCPYKWYSVAAGTDPKSVDDKFLAMMKARQGEFARLAVSEWKTNVLVGLSGVEWEKDKEWLYNSAVLFNAEGKEVDRYSKMHLVPFGEYVPFDLSWLQAFTPYSHKYSCRPGEHFTRFPFMVGDRQFTFGCLICYEDSDPDLARQYVRPENGPPVDFLVNISNDGWFKGTEEHEQHLAICRFRAVEARRTVVRAVNMGISAVIDPDGNVMLPGDSWKESKNMEGMVSDRVKLDKRVSFYAVNGDILPAVCWGFLIVMDVAARVRRRFKRPS
ncbi:apolipoprotein N-acyltransferase [soil metagenome]